MSYSREPLDSDLSITQQVRILRGIIDESNDRLRALGRERVYRDRKLALDRAYPSRLKTKDMTA